MVCGLWALGKFRSCGNVRAFRGLWVCGFFFELLFASAPGFAGLGFRVWGSGSSCNGSCKCSCKASIRLPLRVTARVPAEVP